MKPPRYILPVIVLSQFAGTSLWFAGNAVIGDIIVQFHLPADVLRQVVTAVQLGFITGTLLFAIFTIADRFSPSRIFLLCALAGALCNLGIVWATGLNTILLSRFCTGFFLAGIYPVGMKIAADYHDKGLGKALGYLVGALVLGTAFPHLLKWLNAGFQWQNVIICVSVLAASGGLLLWATVPDGPYRVKGSKPDFRLLGTLFRNRGFRAAAFGYFGHMWELYTFWALVPAILTQYLARHIAMGANVSILSFCVIASGGIACVLGGYIAVKKGSAATAFAALLVSGICCLAVWFMFSAPLFIFLPFLMLWGMAVVTDSPQFTTLIAQSVHTAQRGTALTISNCIGFAITIISIQAITMLQSLAGVEYSYFFLAVGPLLGLWSFRKFIVSV